MPFQDLLPCCSQATLHCKRQQLELCAALQLTPNKTKMPSLQPMHPQGFVALLGSTAPTVQELAAGALCHLVVDSQQRKSAIIAAQALPALAALLRSDQHAVQEATAEALQALAYDSQSSRDAIIAADALPSLVAMLGSNLLESNSKQLALCGPWQLAPNTARVSSLQLKPCRHLYPC